MKNSAEETSHKDILKATGLLGGAQIVEILMKIGRNKIVAVILGPTGVGAIGLYQSTIDLMRSVTGFGINFSAVRDIAEAVGSNDDHRISRVLLVVKRWAWFTGLLGALLTLVLAGPLSLYAFGDTGFASRIAVLSIALPLVSVSEGRIALLQGHRKISMLAQARIFGTVAVFILTVPLYLVFGMEGVVSSILVTYSLGLGLSWYFAGKIPSVPVQIGVRDTLHSGLGMMRLGLFMVFSGFIQSAAMYYLRSFISLQSGIEGVGQFQAAWNLTNIYLSAVLSAMGSDYFPRLSAVNHDNGAMNRLVNEQTEVALLIAGPLIVGMLTFVNPVVRILYSGEFGETVRILLWQLAGMLLKVISWPMAFILLARGKGKVFMCSEIFSMTMLIAPIILLWSRFGIEGSGISYLFAYLCYLCIMIGITKLIARFKWSAASLKLITVYVLLVLVAFLSARCLNGSIKYFAGTVLSLTAVVYSYARLRTIIEIKSITGRMFNR